MKHKQPKECRSIFRKGRILKRNLFMQRHAVWIRRIRVTSQIEPNFIDEWDFDLFFITFVSPRCGFDPPVFGPSKDLYDIFALETLVKCSIALTDLYLPTDSTAIFLLYLVEWSDVIFVCYICMCWSCTITVIVTRPLWPTNLLLNETIYPSPQTHSSYSCYCKHPPRSSWAKVERVKINTNVYRNNWKRPNPSWYGSRQVRWWRLDLSVCRH